MITHIPAPAATTAQILHGPINAATVEGNPKTPLPTIEFTTSATRLQRPMARSSSLRGASSGADSIACLYHKDVMLTKPTEYRRNRIARLHRPSILGPRYGFFSTARLWVRLCSREGLQIYNSPQSGTRQISVIPRNR